MNREPTLIAVEVDEELSAQELLLAFARLAKHESADIEDAAIVSKDADGKIRLRQTRDVMPGQGAASGGWIGPSSGSSEAPSARSLVAPSARLPVGSSPSSVTSVSTIST